MTNIYSRYLEKFKKKKGNHPGYSYALFIQSKNALEVPTVFSGTVPSGKKAIKTMKCIILWIFKEYFLEVGLISKNQSDKIYISREDFLTVGLNFSSFHVDFPKLSLK